MLPLYKSFKGILLRRPYRIGNSYYINIPLAWLRYNALYEEGVYWVFQEMSQDGHIMISPIKKGRGNGDFRDEQS
mgnify:CR=1 FL=1